MTTMVVAAMARADGVDVAIPAESKPLLTTHCVDCHEGARAKGGLDLERALAAGVLVNVTAGNVMRLFPALNIDESELNGAVDVLLGLVKG